MPIKGLVGFAFAGVPREYALEVVEPAGIINDVYVLPEFRSRGIDRKLVVECLEKMKTEKVNAVRLMVLTENRSAIRLYEQLGFRIYRYGMIKALKH